MAMVPVYTFPDADLKTILSSNLRLIRSAQSSVYDGASFNTLSERKSAYIVIGLRLFTGCHD